MFFELAFAAEILDIRGAVLSVVEALDFRANW